ncbi:MAG: hypothetical protein QNK04_29140 [Myxococcota bacterium]|nr:hypothetical protein [Myxococcota bacterium]
MSAMPAAPAVLVLCVALLAGGCNASKATFQLGVPGSSVETSVAQVKPRGGFLDTELHADGFTLRTFLPASELCQRVVAKESGVRYASGSSYGTLVRGDDRCVASGIGSLREWRNRRPRQTRDIIPSAQANFRVVYGDEEVTFVRGDFPLTGLLGFAGMGDSIAVVPNTPVCMAAIASGVSTLEYFHGGRNVLTLSSREGRCNIEGLIRPLAGSDVQP